MHVGIIPWETFVLLKFLMTPVPPVWSNLPLHKSCVILWHSTKGKALTKSWNSSSKSQVETCLLLYVTED